MDIFDITEAINGNDVNKAKECINAGIDLNHVDDHGWTYLGMATYSGNLPLVKMLVEAGADIDSKDKYGETAFDIAVERKDRSGNIHLIYNYLKFYQRIKGA